MDDVGRQVKSFREERGWTQPKLAVEAGMAVSAVNQIENGKRSPSAASLIKLATALGVEVADLFPKVEAPLWSDEPVEERRVSLAALTAWADYLGLMLQRWGELETELRAALSRYLASEERGNTDLQRALVRTHEFLHGAQEVIRAAGRELFVDTAFDVGRLEAPEQEALRIIRKRAYRLDKISDYFTDFLGRLETAIEEQMWVRQIVEEFLESVRVSEQSTEEVRQRT